ncbi:MAG: sigma-54-dependent Fis family transcriptional regulator [Thalassospira sp.]|uniref:sigma-54-dependent transcriptional regulator n=1 Tax=Thalassospira sp. GB04J01 TaxID=1485225 RepID=UPI000C0F148F|nr:sigma-54 dependent transcriptional regulator [Thalassospira sp. GB04J01]MBV16831.1 sigma-54-dependent Fis family transcriptional regulator [Thalassospira sp.]|tara:strand:+ start:4819 stop:6372 length:1554 start_codon:yes stop_codon:yes gene_type:complete
MQVLIVGGLGGQIGAASKIAMARGASVQLAESVTTALNILRAGNRIDVVMADITLDVAALIDAISQERINVPVVACGVGNDVNGAVNAIKAGAQEFIPLPPEADLIAAIFEAVTEESHALIHRDPKMAETLRLATQVAKSSASILITGESGTGKEIISRFVHRKSNRADKPFVAVNCAAIPDNLLESELFGHEKGAFTGAQARRIGKFEEANNGTLLLDEISEMDVRLQAKLLRAIQEKEIDRLGGKSPVKIDVRILATSNRNLEAEVNAGNFREDLYFRLNVVNLDIPSLRERPDDIPVLAEFFVKKYSEANDMPLRPISQLAIQRLLSHHWRGNVRELENTLHRAVLVAGPDEIGPEAILLTGSTASAPAPSPAPAATEPASPAPSTASPSSRASSAYANANAAYGAASSAYKPSAPSAPAPHSTEPDDTSSADANTDNVDAQNTVENGSGTSSLVGRTVAAVERDLIIDTLKHCFGNRTHAANILGISIRTLRNKLRQYTDDGLAVPAPGDGHD